MEQKKDQIQFFFQVTFQILNFYSLEYSPSYRL